MTTKTRRWVPELVAGQTRPSQFSPYVPYSDAGPSSFETVTGSTNRKIGNHWSGGGYFQVDRDVHYYQPSSIYTENFSIGGNPLGTGTTRIGNPQSAVANLPRPALKTNTELLAMGTTAIARCEPTRPSFDLSVALGELMAEGIPLAPGASALETTNLANKAGSEYLNQVFGWQPLVGSIKDFATTVENSDAILRKFQEKANTPIKRSYDWPPITATQYTPCAFVSAGNRGFFSGGGRLYSVKQEIWFEGSFIYHLPVGSSNDARMRRFGANARKLLGIDLSPEVLWNLAPWSWAVDWVTNTGDVLHNISAMGTDGMALRYGHIMCHTVRTTIDSGYLNSDPKKYMVHTRIEEQKLRLPATPFGFGVIYSSLSPRQIAILSALGLSRW